MNKSWNKIKEIILQLRGLTIIGTADVVANVVSAIFWFYMAVVLGAEHYGKISYFIAIGSIASTISLIGAQNSLMVFVAKNVKLQSPIYFITIISGSITSVILFFIFYNLGVSTYVLATVIFGLATSEILGQKLYYAYSKYLLTQRILMVGLAVGLYYLLGYEGVILGLALSFFPYLIRIYEGFKESKIDFSLIKSRFGFIMNSYITSILGAFDANTDKLIIAPLLGFILLGYYQLGIQFLTVLEILPSIVFKYILPQDASGNPSIKLKKGIILFSVGLAIFGVSLSPFFIPTVFPKFTDAIRIIQIMSVAVIPSSISLVYTSKFLAAEKTKIVLVSSGLYLIVLIVSIIVLGKIFGVNGAAIAFVLSTSSQAAFYLITNQYIKLKKK